MTYAATVTMPRLHRTQRQVRLADHRFTVLACGRRWGKTRLGGVQCFKVALEGGLAWWVAPTYKMSNVGWRLAMALGSQVPGAQISKTDRRIDFPTGGAIEVRSADEPNSLRGEGLNFLVVDECAFMKSEAWTHALRPSLSDRKGGAVFISTPKGRNWFWRLWETAKESPEWGRFHFTSYDNPKIDPREIDAAKEELPERVFRQEYLAEFLDDAGGVFRRVVEACTETPQTKALEGHQYVFGIDWGKEVDYTVVAVVDVSLNAIVCLDRFNQVDYQLQLTRINALHNRFAPTAIIAEKNNVGQPLIESMQRMGMPVQAFTTTGASKTTIVDNLALALDSGNITMIPDVNLVSELQAFEMTQLVTHTRYAAPEGMHDDCVIAACLAWWGSSRKARSVKQYYG